MSFSATPDRSVATAVVAPGSKDGRGCGDHDQPYTFGRRPRAASHFPFTDRQFARLLALRGRVRDGAVGADDTDQAGLELSPPAPQVPQAQLVYTCAACGAMVAGALQNVPLIACARCAQDGGRDGAARAILFTAGVIEGD
jgi:hypothetical protein